jgi:DNA-binding protein HU-beta
MKPAFAALGVDILEQATAVYGIAEHDTTSQTVSGVVRAVVLRCYHTRPSDHEAEAASGLNFARPRRGCPYPRKPARVQLKEKTMAATKSTKLTKSQVFLALSEQTELSRKDVGRVFDALSALVAKQLVGRGSPGEVTIPGLLKLKAVKKPATKEREGINPFTKEPITIAAKPASKKVKAIPIKALKEMVQ